MEVRVRRSGRRRRGWNREGSKIQVSAQKKLAEVAKASPLKG